MNEFLDYNLHWSMNFYSYNDAESIILYIYAESIIGLTSQPSDMDTRCQIMLQTHLKTVVASSFVTVRPTLYGSCCNRLKQQFLLLVLLAAGFMRSWDFAPVSLPAWRGWKLAEVPAQLAPTTPTMPWIRLTSSLTSTLCKSPPVSSPTSTNSVTEALVPFTRYGLLNN